MGLSRAVARAPLARLRDAVRDGSWASAGRLRAYATILIGASLLGIVGLLLTGDGLRDVAGRPYGTDFSQVWVAGRAVLAGHPAAPFDPATHAAAQRAVFGPATPFYGWHYPPYFLALAAALALLPYGAALAVWQGASGLAYWAAMLAASGGMGAASRSDRRGLSTADVSLAALAFPAVLINLTHGHNGFLTAALMGFGCLLMRRRPRLAGLLFGLLCYKPQFALVLPVALLAAGAWRTLGAAVLTVAAATFATLAAFGSAPWLAFRASLAFTRTVVLEQGDTGWEKIQSPFAAVRLLGGSLDIAYAAQALVTLGLVAAVAITWRGGADRRLKAALLMVASLLATPYCLDYDLMLLGPALMLTASLAQDTGWRAWEKSLLAAVWAMPAVVRLIGGAFHVPLGTPLMLAFVILLLRRSRDPA